MYKKFYQIESLKNKIDKTYYLLVCWSMINYFVSMQLILQPTRQA